MVFFNVIVGLNLFYDIYVIVEILMDVDFIKYEVDKVFGVIFVDWVLFILMCYLCNYGYMFKMLCGDGDLIDVLIVMLILFIFGLVIVCWLVGVMYMFDENGEDVKIIVVFNVKVFFVY